MRTVRVVNSTRESVLAHSCEVAESLFTRVRGLLGRSGLEEGQGMLIIPCPSIHMFGMKFALDAVFIDEENMVVDFVESLAPGKMYVARALEEGGAKRKPRAAIELPCGAIARSQTQRGDQLELGAAASTCTPANT
jgi:uncharacterized membrane protein (UPF0127 family)